MTTAAAHRAPNSKARTTPPGTGELHRALEDARDRAQLEAFCSAHVCTPAEVSADGKRLDILRILDLYRTRGCQITAPARASHQPRKGYTAWMISVQLPQGPSFDMGFFTTNAP